MDGRKGHMVLDNLISVLTARIAEWYFILHMVGELRIQVYIK